MVGRQNQQITRQAKVEDYKKERQKLRKLIRKKKRRCWGKFLEEQENRHPWNVARIAKDPFKTKTTCGDLKNHEGAILRTDQEKCAAFQKHNFIIHNQQFPSPPIITESPIAFQKASDQHIKLVSGPPKNPQQLSTRTRPDLVLPPKTHQEHASRPKSY